MTIRARLRRWLPWAIGIAILVALVLRIPVAAFRDAMKSGTHLELAAVDLAVAFATLASDSIATFVGLVALHARRRFFDVLAVRGATYLLVLLNYAVGQGGFGYYLHKSGMSSLRATGSTLFLIGINLAALLLVTPATWLVLGVGAPNAPTWWLVVIGCSGFAAYLVAIAIAPKLLASRELLAPLFDAGLRGHALAIAGRLPHVAVIIVGQWLALRVWGIAVPFADAASVMAAVAIASSLPISPGGLGTSQAALVYFFSTFVVAPTSDERTAAVLAFSIMHFVYAMLASVVVGAICAPAARRVLAREDQRTSTPVS